MYVPVDCLKQGVDISENGKERHVIPMQFNESIKNLRNALVRWKGPYEGKQSNKRLVKLMPVKMFVQE